MFGVLVKRAQAIEYLLVLFIIVMLGTRLTSGGEDVFWPAAVILAWPVSSCSIMAAITMIATVIRAVVIMTSVVGAIVVSVRWLLSAHILVEAHLSFLCIGVLVGGSYHFNNTGRRLMVEFGAKLTMVVSLDKGGDDFSFRDVGDRVPHLGETPDVATEELDGFWLMQLRSCFVLGRVHVAI